MKTLLATALIISLLTCLCMPVTAADIVTEEMEDITANYVENQIIVLTDYYVSPEDYASKISLFFGVAITDIQPLFTNDTEEQIATFATNSGNCFPYLITTISGVDIDEAVEILNNESQIIVADKNYIFELEHPECTIAENNDETYEINSSWSQDAIGLGDAWTKTFIGSESFVVAVMDSGFNVSHPDINCFDTTNAYNVGNESSNVTPDSPENLNSIDTYHGTFVSGIIGATYNNSIGLDGVCQNVTILPIKIPGLQVAETSSNNAILMSGIYHAIENNAKVVNASISIPTVCDTVLITAIERAEILFVTAAGNKNIGMTGDFLTTGIRNDSPYWIVVGASDSSNNRWYDSEQGMGSNFNATYCDLFAPGANIYSTKYSGYGTLSGTSFATPYVTGACALIMSKATHLTPLEVKSYIMNNVTIISSFSNLCVSSGILSISNAIEAIYAENRGAYSKGDLNGSGYITSTDYTICQQIYTNTYSGTPTSAQLDAADINNNGSVDSRDYLLLKRYVGRTYYFIP